MENASKALIMAGSVLIAILILSLLIYAFNVFTEYQDSKDEIALIEDTSKFNEQFTNYDRDNVRGYELLSLVNQVIDYNKRRSNVTGSTNDENYDPITIKINLNTNDFNKTSLSKDSMDRVQVFLQDTYTQSDTNNVFGNIMDDMKKIEDCFGGSAAATNLAKSFDEIYNDTKNDDSRLDENRKKVKLDIFCKNI